MDTVVDTTMARLDDDAAMAEFISTIPNGEELGKLLDGRKPLSTRAYDDATQTARFVESDGDTVMCFRVTDITIDQAEMITIEWEVISALDETEFQKAVGRALHESFTHENR
jgi:hypothetical protein